MDENQNNTEAVKKGGMNPLLPLAIVGLIVVAVIGIFVVQGQQKENTLSVIEATSVPTREVNTDSTTAPMDSEAQSYKDGTYNVKGDYVSPGGPENIDVTLTINEGIIESAEVKSLASRPNSVKFQGIFVENYKQFVVGKNIDEVKLDKVAGSSLTPKGFNDALEKIKTEAKA